MPELKTATTTPQAVDEEVNGAPEFGKDQPLTETF
jgi:hypothetical protein